VQRKNPGLREAGAGASGSPPWRTIVRLLLTLLAIARLTPARYWPLLASRRLYRFSTEARFSFPLGKATSPAAVPLLPLRPETAASTSLIISRTTPAVVKAPRSGVGTGPMAVSPLWGGLLRTLVSF
jgi:hypothetical protein